MIKKLSIKGYRLWITGLIKLYSLTHKFVIKHNISVIFNHKALRDFYCKRFLKLVNIFSIADSYLSLSLSSLYSCSIFFSWSFLRSLFFYFSFSLFLFLASSIKDFSKSYYKILNILENLTLSSTYISNFVSICIFYLTFF